MAANEEVDVKKLFKQVQLSSIMSTPPIVLNIDEAFHKVDLKFREHNIKHLLIVNDRKQLIGMITLQDLYKIQSPKKTADGTAYYDHNELDLNSIEKNMTIQPVSLKGDALLMDAMVKMGEGGFGCIPVVDDDFIPIGVVTQTDIIRVVSEIFKE